MTSIGAAPMRAEYLGRLHSGRSYVITRLFVLSSRGGGWRLLRARGRGRPRRVNDQLFGLLEGLSDAVCRAFGGGGELLLLPPCCLLTLLLLLMRPAAASALQLANTALERPQHTPLARWLNTTHADAINAFSFVLCAQFDEAEAVDAAKEDWAQDCMPPGEGGNEYDEPRMGKAAFLDAMFEV